VKDRGGAALFTQYKSLPEALQAIYPDHSWDPTKFLQGAKAQNRYWVNLDNQRAFLDEVAESLGIVKV